MIHGGGLQHTASALIIVGVMRSERVGCTLPIEYWHRGDAAPTPELAAAMKKIRVTPRNLDAAFPPGYLAAGADFDSRVAFSGVEGLDTAKYGGDGGGDIGEQGSVYVPTLPSWAAKPVAVLLSSFEEVVAIDADAIPLVDPEVLFASAPYVRGAALFWDDLSADNAPSDSFAFKVSGLLLDREEDAAEETAAGGAAAATTVSSAPAVTADPVAADDADAVDFIGASVKTARKFPGYLRRRFESGQMVVHKGRHWRQLCLAAYFNAERVDYFWNRNLGFYGGDLMLFSPLLRLRRKNANDVQLHRGGDTANM